MVGEAGILQAWVWGKNPPPPPSLHWHNVTFFIDNHMFLSHSTFCRGRALVRRTLVACSWCASLHLTWLVHFTWVTPSPTPFRTLSPDGSLRWTVRSNIKIVIHSIRLLHLSTACLKCFAFLQAQDARRDHPVEPGLWPRWHRHPGGGGKKAEEREGSEPPWPGQGNLHRGNLEVEEWVSWGRCESSKCVNNTGIKMQYKLGCFAFLEKETGSTTSWRNLAPVWTGTEPASPWTLWGFFFFKIPEPIWIQF